MSSKWDIYSRQGLDMASAVSSIYFSLAKSSTRFGFSITHRVASSIASVTSTIVDHALFGGTTVTSPVLSSTISTVISLAEQITLAPIHVGEYLTTTSLLAAHSSINVLSVIFPGSSEASFSLASFISLVKREWSEPAPGEHLPAKKFGVTQIARALIAWVALQGVTQEWQEKQWFASLREIHVEEPRKYTDPLRERKNSRVRVTSDIIFPGNKGQIISADIGEAPHSRAQPVRVKSASRVSAIPPPTTHRPRMLATKAGQAEMKATLRRLSKMVLAGYGGASLLFFGVSPHATDPSSPRSKSVRKEKLNEEAQLAHAIDASEAEAFGDSEVIPPPQPLEEYSWWDVLLGRHDQEIFERFAMDGGEKQEEEMKMKMKATAVIGIEHQMPRFWVLTDHSRGQIVLVLRGTMSLNEIAVDLTCEPEEFEPATTLSNEDEELILGLPGTYRSLPISSEPPSTTFSSSATTPSSKHTSPVMTPFPSTAGFPPMNHSTFTFPSMTQDTYTRRYPSRRSSISSLFTSTPRYHVHSGMLRMAKAMGDVGKPVQVAVMDALFRNPDYDLVLCGHSLGAGVAALIGLMWADPKICKTVRSSGLPVGRCVSVYCFAPPCITDPHLSYLSSKLIVSFVYSHDVVSRLSLGSVRDIKNAAMWLCDADERTGDGKDGSGYTSVTQRARQWKAGWGNNDDPDWFIAVRKTLEANMQMSNMYPPGRVLWAMRDSDLHPSHRKQTNPMSTRSSASSANSSGLEDKLRLFEVLDVEKVFSQIVFAKDMLSAHMPHQYDRVLHDLL